MPDQLNNQKFARKIEFFKSDLKVTSQRKVFEEKYNENNGKWSVIKSELEAIEGFNPEIISSLEFTHNLAEWSEDNEDFISVFQKDNKIKSMRDIAIKFNKIAFIEKVKDFSPAELEEEKNAFALNLHRELFNMEPTALLVNMIKDPQVSILNDAIGANVAAVLEKQPDFNIRTTSIYMIIKNEEALKDIPSENHGMVVNQLKTLQRITAISPDTDALPVLYKANIHSAEQISALPKKQFMSVMSKSGLDDQTLMQIHVNAQQAHVRNEQVMMSLREVYQGTGVAMIDKSMATETAALEDTLPKHNLSWDLLFGDADFCECDECASVYSASAYFVELLQYLRNNNLDSDTDPNTLISIKSDPKDISGTPLEKLFDRRPDLGCLELTCKNTNTVLPYIDLVNEVMENYVAFKHLKPFNVEDEASSELLAEPQHTEYQAYCILKDEVYPFTLPYHQPIDAKRIYLKHLDTSRHELIKTFRKDNSSDDAELTRLKDEVLDRAADAEFLGMTMEEYVILTKECFESKALIDKRKNKIHTDTEYQQVIGVKPVHEYYAFKDDGTMLGDEGLTLIKREFLHRTGIDYFNLVDLLKISYINPYLPKGNSKTIMESLHFSYRFLQNYAKIYGIDKMAEDLVKGEKLAELMPKRKELIELLTNKKTLSCPKPNQDEIEISDKDIIHWVKCHFEKVGKMIVIESGKGPLKGKIIHSSKEITKEVGSIEDYKIFSANKDGKTEVGSIDKESGKVLPKDPQKPIDVNDFKELSFISDKGEKGVFLVIEREVHLVLLEQQDSCDLDTALLQHLDGTPLTIEEYDRIHRFIRLWRKLNWTIEETNQAIVSFSRAKIKDGITEESICADCGDDCQDPACEGCEKGVSLDVFDINPNLIHQLTAVKELLDKTGLELTMLLTFWNDISTVEEKSLYQRLFLTRNVLGIDKIFKADSKGSYLVTDAKLLGHTSAIMAALNLTFDDIQAIMQANEMDDKLTLQNLSLLYRYRLLAKVLGLRIPDFVSVLTLLGNAFEDAHTSLEFMENWEKIEASGFSSQQLNYIIRNADDNDKPFAPAQKTVLQLSKTLYDGLNAIDEAHKDLKADPSITDAALQKINIQEQASSAVIRTKISLLFEADTVEKIIGLLEGTNTFTTNAPKNLDFTLPEISSLKNKLKYEKNVGAIQVTGTLTEAEVTDYQALVNNTEWNKAIVRIQKQQDKLFKELLSGAFEEEKSKTSVEKEQLEALIKSGDITIPLDKISEGEADTNTAPQKRVAFLEIFSPYLRQQLSRQFVIEMLSNFTELDAQITDALVSEVLKTELSETPIYSIFEKIKESAKPDETNWSGYLIPAAEASYTFIIKDSDPKPVVSIDGHMLDFTAQEDPTNEWWSASISLQAGKLYKLAAAGSELKNILWKTPVSAITSIPSSAVIPDFASSQCETDLLALKKAAMLVSTFDLSAEEIRFLDLHKSEFGDINFNTFTFPHWLRLEAYTRLRNSLPQTKINILDFWNWIYETASEETELTEKIAALTDWKKEHIGKLMAVGHFNNRKLEDYRNEKTLLKLQESLTVAGKIGIDIDLLFEWAVPSSKFNHCRRIADSIKNAIRAKYNQTDWEQVVKPLHDQLRNNQKEALIGYLLQQKELLASNVIDADGLFEYFLIDVQMEPCMETSRIKQAISSVQLFVQRCFLGLEEADSSIKAGILDRERWEWMQRYRVWEANRKVFLYPENWIESNLRDDKSPFFKELESELLQKDINKKNVTDALKAYLYKVDEVANMEVIGLYIGGTKTRENWSKDAKLHVFSRTRNAPYLFYYRYLALDEMNWYPWEKMQVDIPSYDVEDPDTHEVKDNGCYLTPVVWNGRLLIFFPQIMKKTKPNPESETGSFTKLGNDDKGIDKAKPIEFYEIKMAWSEYRNGKWTQKQISKDAVFSNAISEIYKLQFFKFVPTVSGSKVTIHVNDRKSGAGDYRRGEEYRGAFEFNGTAVMIAKEKSMMKVKELMGIDYFNQADGKLYSWQIEFLRSARQLYFYEDNYREKIGGLDSFHSEFNHSGTQNLLGKINLGQLDLFFKENLSMPGSSFGPFNHDDVESTPDIYHELKQPYSLYNWELFFHTPILLADALSKSQQFEEAMKWFHFVFNPIAAENENNRFWQFKPFKNIDSQKVLDSIFNNLKPNTADKKINEWRNNPFMPHAVARNRPVAYMKWVVMKYIDNLLAWGDHLFRQDTIESINQATQLYVLAGHILGQRPMMIPKRGKTEPQTYLGLLDKWDAFGNAMGEMEVALPFSNQTALPFSAVNKEIAFVNIFGSASALYFGIPNNPKLMGYWDTLADRLYKIRHCQNMEGVFRKLALFEPSIDPALLVKAAAQGLSMASVLNDLNTPMSNYRFYYLLQKALELCNELKSLGSSMLSAIEKKDNETVTLIRAKHEGVMQNLLMEIKKKQLEEAQKNLESLIQNRKAPEARMKYYLKLSGLDEDLVPADTADFNEIANDIVTVDGESGLKLIRFEKEEMDKASEAQDWQVAIGITETLASILHLIPFTTIDAKPIGVGAGIGIHGQMFGNATQAIAKGMQTYSNSLSSQSSQSGKKGGFTRSIQERIFQANAAGYELKQIDKQITAQEIRIDIANQEIANQQKAIDNANEVEEFIKNKYSNEELYTWMRGSLKTLYHQVYNLAYELAKKAEKTYCFERGISSANFIQSGYFDAGRDGLLAGEQLYVGLKQLEAAYQNERGYDYEITKTVSLHQISPLAVIQLKETGKCEFTLPEVLFDMNYPGHYKRRIKSVAVSIPCIAGPYTGVNATLSLLENKFRNTALGGTTYEENIDEDIRFNSYAVPINAIAASSAQNDSGMFELNFKDERYLPFEGAGVISKWRLELPTFRQFDYRSIPDVIVHLRYTANEGGERLKSAATQSVSNSLKIIEQELNETGLHMALNMKHDLPNEWFLLKKKGTVELKIDRSRLPYIAQTIDTAVEHLMLIARVKDNPTTFSVGIGLNGGIDVEETSLGRIDEWKLVQGESTKIKLDEPFTLSVDAAQLNNLEELNLVVKYKF